MTDLTPEQQIDKILDWQTYLLIREAVVQDVVDTKNIHITEEMLMTAKNEAKQQLLALKKKWENEARIDELKTVASVHCGIPTKTVKRADLKCWIVYKINQLNGGK